MVGRNDPCVCGSGKKYKRCCGNTNEAFLEQQVAVELHQVLVGAYEQSANQEDLAEFRMDMKEWKEKLENLWETQRIEEAISAYFLFVKRSDLWQRHIVELLNGTLRSTVRSVVEAWKSPIVLLGKVKGEQDGVLEIGQVLTDETFYLKKKEGMLSNDDTYVCGVVLPDNRKHQNGVYAVSSLLFKNDVQGTFEDDICSLAKTSGFERSADIFKEYMVDIYGILLGKPTESKNEFSEDNLVEEVEEIQETEEILEIEEAPVEVVESTTDNSAQEDLTPIQEETVALLDKTLVERETNFETRSRLKNICVTYLLEEEPKFRKANVVAAGVFRAAIDCEILIEAPMTNSAVATLFDVSPASMAKHADSVRELIPRLYEEASTVN